jgi:hypothetical protein
MKHGTHHGCERSVVAELCIKPPPPFAAPGMVKSASRPPSEFWYFNDKTIKELMSFAKCEWKNVL